MKDSEELVLLRFRYGRAAEIFLAYKTFLFREIMTGEKNYCQTEQHVKSVTHILLITFYSFVYSLFDKSGVDFISTTEPYSNYLSDTGKKIRDELIEIWEENKTSMAILRNNVGFHGGKKFKNFEAGYSALSSIHPQTSELIMIQLAIFFFELDELIPNENKMVKTSNVPEPEKKEFLLKRAENFKKYIKENPFKENFLNLSNEEMQALYTDFA